MRILLLVLAGSVIVLLFAVWAAVRAVRRHGSDRRKTAALGLHEPAEQPPDAED